MGERRIKLCKNSFMNWINGSKSVSNDSVLKHVRYHKHGGSEPTERSDMGAEVYKERIVMNSLIARGFMKLSLDDRAALE